MPRGGSGGGGARAQSGGVGARHDGGGAGEAERRGLARALARGGDVLGHGGRARGADVRGAHADGARAQRAQVRFAPRSPLLALLCCDLSHRFSPRLAGPGYRTRIAFQTGNSALVIDFSCSGISLSSVGPLFIYAA